MEITYEGGSAFNLAGSRAVHFNPASTKAMSGIALYSRRQRSTKQIVNGPGEYEISGVLIATLAIEGADGERLAHAVDLDGASVLLVDTTITELDIRRLSDLGRIDILLITGANMDVSRQLVTALVPRVVIPYGEKASDVCTVLGVQEQQPISKLSWTLATRLPKAVLLKAPGRRSRVA